MKNLNPVLIAGLASAALQAPAHSADPVEKTMTSRGMITLSAKAADAKAKQDLLSILQPTGKFRQGMFASVRGIAMDTIAHGTGMKGLCAMDMMTLWYDATAVKAEPMDEPKRPVSISVSHFFHAVGKALPEHDEAAATANTWGADCKNVQSDKSAHWFLATDTREAARGVNVLVAAMAAVRSGNLKAKNCNIGSDGGSCEERLLQLGQVGKMNAVDKHCAILASASTECFEIRTTDSVEFTIVASFADDNAVEPDEVQSIAASDYVTVT